MRPQQLGSVGIVVWKRNFLHIQACFLGHKKQFLCSAQLTQTRSLGAGQFPGCVRLNGMVWFFCMKISSGGEVRKKKNNLRRSTSDPDLTGFCNPPWTGFCNDSFMQDVLTCFFISEKQEVDCNMSAFAETYDFTVAKFRLELILISSWRVFHIDENENHYNIMQNEKMEAISRRLFEYPQSLFNSFTFYCSICQNIIKLSSQNCNGVSGWHWWNSGVIFTSFPSHSHSNRRQPLEGVADRSQKIRMLWYSMCWKKDK